MARSPPGRRDQGSRRDRDYRSRSRDSRRHDNRGSRYDRDRGYQRDRPDADRYRDRDRRPQDDRRRDRDEPRNRDRLRDRDGPRERDRLRDRDGSRDRGAPRNRDGSRDRDRLRDRDGTRDGDGSRDRGVPRNRDGSRDRDRIRDRDGTRSRDYRERDQPYDRDRPQDRNRPHDRDGPSDRKRAREEDSSPVRHGEHRHDLDRYGDASNGRSKRRRGSYASNNKDSRPSTATANAAKPASDMAQVSAENIRKQEERKAAILEWKKRMLADRASQSITEPVSSAEEDSESSDTDSEVTVASENRTNNESTTSHRTPWDPQAIRARVEAKTQRLKKATLDHDVNVPVPVATSLAVPMETLHRPNAKEATIGNVEDPKIGGFGLNKSADNKNEYQDGKIIQSKALDEDEEVARKFSKLPKLAQADVLMQDNVILQHESETSAQEAEVIGQTVQHGAQASKMPLKIASSANSFSGPASTVRSGREASAAPEGEQVDSDEEPDTIDAYLSSLYQQPASTNRVRKTNGKIAASATRIFEDEPVLDAVGENPGNLLALSKKPKRTLPIVDHSKIQYEDFRKSFYTEPVEIASMSVDDVKRLRYDLDGITVRGVNVPTPITKWPQSGLGSAILDVLRRQKFDKPTSIQAQALPAIMSGRDVIGIAKTGSGKTLAFLLPLFRHIKDQRPLATLDGPIGLILAPTRELVTQIETECRPYMKALNLRAVAAYGGAPIKDQIAELKRGAYIIVATPGRMHDLLTSNQGRVTNLRRVTYVVLDEADRMFDMGFGPQIQKLLHNIRPDRQAVFFSATFPRKMETIARECLEQPVEIQAGGRTVVAPEVTQVIKIYPQNQKFTHLLELLGNLFEEDNEARALIFVERQEAADIVFKALFDAGYASVSVHGGREQIDRDQAMIDFKNGNFRIMIATSVAARGLDVKQLKLVVNFDSPNHGEDYVHRAGRTGRAGNLGTCVTFLTPEQERFAGMLVRALKDSKQPIPEDLQKMADAFREKYKSGEVKYGEGVGFGGGKGIERFDVARAAERAREKRQYGPEDESAEAEKEDEEKKAAASKKAEQLVAKAVGGVQERDAQAAQAAQAEVAVAPDSFEARLNNFAKVQKHERPEKPKPKQGMDPMALVRAKAEALNARIGAANKQGRVGGLADNRGPDAGAYHSTIEVNDFPQKARWAVTNRSNVAKILDATGVSITMKGQYYPEGTAPEPGGEPKLYCLVEGDTEPAVAAAVAALTEHLKEGLLAAQESEVRAPPGRYTIS